MYVHLQLATTILLFSSSLAQLLQPSSVKEDLKSNNKSQTIVTIGDYIRKTTKEHTNIEPASAKKLTTEITNDEIENYSDKEYRPAFDRFKEVFKLSYIGEEDAYRFEVFKNNLKRILIHNNSSSSYKMSINQFSAFTEQEFKDANLSNELPIKAPIVGARMLQEETTDPNIMERLKEFAAEIDWTTKGVITPVKSQSQCQACYVFSAVASLETAIAIRYGKRIILSEQEILDCSFGYRNNGCAGGQPGFVYDYVNVNGINLDTSYPYAGVEGRCRAPTKQPVFKKLKSHIILQPDIVSVIEAVQYGAVVVNHYVPDDFKYYSTGIFDTTECNKEVAINHSAIIVGYNFNTPVPYFKLKNSWGAKWGDAGFYKVKIGPLNFKNPGFCNLASNGYNAFPIV